MASSQSLIEWIFTEKKLAKVTLFSLPEVFCGPQICQKCIGGRGSVPNPAAGAHDAPQTS